MLDYLYIYPFPHKVKLVWQYSDSNMSVLPYFFIERSLDDQNTWTRLNSVGIDGYMYWELSLPSVERLDKVWYRLIVSIDSVETVLETVNIFTHWSQMGYKLISKLLQAEQIRLKGSRIGVPGEFQKRRTAGVPCDCLDPVTKTPTNPDCSTCSGTLMQDGFYDGETVYTQYSTLQEYEHQWRELTGSFSTDARVIRVPAHIVWREGDRWYDRQSGKTFKFTSQYKVLASLQGSPVAYAGLIDKLPND